MELHERTIVISESRSIEEDSLASPFLPLHQHFAEIDVTVTITMSQCHSLLILIEIDNSEFSELLILCIDCL